MVRSRRVPLSRDGDSLRGCEKGRVGKIQFFAKRYNGRQVDITFAADNVFDRTCVYVRRTFSVTRTAKSNRQRSGHYSQKYCMCQRNLCSTGALGARWANDSHRRRKNTPTFEKIQGRCTPGHLATDGVEQETRLLKGSGEREEHRKNSILAITVYLFWSVN